MRAGQEAGRIEKLDRGRRHLLGFVERRQVVQPRVGQRGDSDLAGMDLAGIGMRSRQELKQRALAAAREPDDSDTHPSIFLVCRRIPAAGSQAWPDRMVHGAIGSIAELIEAPAITGSSSSLRGHRVAHRAPRANRARARGARIGPDRTHRRLAGDVGDRLGRVSPGRSRTCGRGRRTRSGFPPACARGRTGEQLGQSPVEEDPGRERRRVEPGPRSHQKHRCASRNARFARPAARRQDEERDDEPANTDEGADVSEMEQTGKPAPEQRAELDVLLAHLERSSGASGVYSRRSWRSPS